MMAEPIKWRQSGNFDNEDGNDVREQKMFVNHTDYDAIKGRQSPSSRCDDGLDYPTGYFGRTNINHDDLTIQRDTRPA